MIIAGQPFPYAGNFHNDQGTIEDPTGATSRIRNTAGTWSGLAAPTKQDGKTGHFGGSVDTTGFAKGVYLIRMEGTVTTAKTTAKEFSFTVVDPADFKANVAAVKTDTERLLAEVDNTRMIFKEGADWYEGIFAPGDTLSPPTPTIRKSLLTDIDNNTIAAIVAGIITRRGANPL